MLLAEIDGTRCVGCTKCLQACPVDAISGAAGYLHEIITTECIGCKLCVAPCPVDCITMIERPPEIAVTGELKQQMAAQAKQRYIAKQQRLAKQYAAQALPAYADEPERKAQLRSEVQASLARMQDKYR